MSTPALPTALRAAAALAALLLVPAAAAAQGEPGAGLRVFVTTASTGESVVGAEVRVEGTEAGGVTGEDGSATLRGLPDGTRVVEVSRIGLAPRRVEVALHAGRVTSVAVTLDDSPVPVDELQAEAVTWGELMLDSRGFYQRQQGSPGIFLTRDDIARRRPRTMAQLLNRYARVDEAMGGISTSASRRNAGGRCPVAYFVDGMHVEAFDVNGILPTNVEGVEVYRGASSVPPEFNRGSAACGAIVIWTRVN